MLHVDSAPTTDSRTGLSELTDRRHCNRYALNVYRLVKNVLFNLALAIHIHLVVDEIFATKQDCRERPVLSRFSQKRQPVRTPLSILKKQTRTPPAQHRC